VKGSLRARLTLGALTWMTAVLLAVIALMVRLTRNHPELALRHATRIAMAILVVASVVAALFLVRKALAPFGTLRAGLSLVREGRSQRIDGDYPSEVQPLVSDLNALLEDRERAVARALTTAGDLAHGLKTPLAVLVQEAEQAAAAATTSSRQRSASNSSACSARSTITWPAPVRPPRRVQPPA
jgi:signal transduction histidine kinase